MAASNVSVVVLVYGYIIISTVAESLPMRLHYYYIYASIVYCRVYIFCNSFVERVFGDRSNGIYK